MGNDMIKGYFHLIIMSTIAASAVTPFTSGPGHSGTSAGQASSGRFRTAERSKGAGVPSSLGHTHHTYYYIAGVHAVLGDTDKAMAWLERSVDTGWACWPFFRIDPHLENLRETLPFKRLVADLEQTYTAIVIASWSPA